MMTLAPRVGRGRAHDIVHHALEAGGPAALYSDPEISQHLSAADITAALDPANYLGDSASIAREAAQLAVRLATRFTANAQK